MAGNDDLRYKTKYLDQLDLHEKAEKLWEQQREELGRLLIRVCLAAEGQDEQLDPTLKGLREQIRSNKPDRSKILLLQTRLESQVRQFDDQRAARLQRLAQNLNDLIDQLMTLDPPREQEKRLKALGRDISKQEVTPARLPDLLAQLVRLQQQVLGHLQHQSAQSGTEHNEHNERGGFLRRLFGSAKGKKNGADQQSPPDMVPQYPADTTELDTGEDETVLLVQLSRQIAQVVGQLLEQISLPVEWEVRGRQLRERLAVSEDWDELRLALDEVGNLVMAAVGRGQREFEQFLQSLDERLSRIQEHVSDEVFDTQSWHSNTQALGEAVQNELQALNDDVHSANDLNGLQRSVKQHVDRIGSSLDHFRRMDSDRETQLSEQLTALRQKLVALEAQSEEMHRQLREERARALTDVLTRLPNREAWQERVDTEYRRWQRYSQPVSLAVVDIDLFKRINDSYGHLAGDRVLQLIARTLRDRLRETDFVARYGGEEFVVLMPETTLAQGIQVMDKLRQFIAELPFHFRQERVDITFSAGIAIFSGDLLPDQVFEAADKALYRAKQEGRNRVIADENSMRAEG